MERGSSAPLLFDLSNESHAAQLERLKAVGAIRRISDDYEEQLRELYAIRHPAMAHTPQFDERFQTYLESVGDLRVQGRWAYFPWCSSLSHILPEEEFFIVRTARNRNLITEEEQKKFYGATIGIAGLSVGSSIAFAIVLQGGGKHLKLADMDRLALTNTNRVLTGVTELGELKVEMAARRIYEMNPYASLTLYPEGLNGANIAQFFDGLDIVIDELDNIAVKYLIREQAKAHRIAVVMGADNGDNAVVDIERYDLDDTIPFFHGRLGEVTYQELDALDKRGIGKTITKHIGPENVTVRMLHSLMEMGKTVVSWPQLGGAAMLNGAAVANCVRRIITGQDVEGKRALVSLDEKLIPSHSSPEELEQRKHAERKIREHFDI